MIHKGTYDGTIYHNPANRFCIISVKTADKEVPLEARSTRRYRDHLIRFVATGYELPRTDAVELELDGEWKQGKYGMQFQVEQWRQIVPRTKSGVEGYLASGLIKGIGPATATLIVSRFGEDTLDILQKRPERLLEIKGITESKLEEIKTSYAESRMLQDLLVLLSPFKITPKTALKIYQYFGPASVDILKKSPFELCQISGFGFLRVDAIVQKNGGDLHDPMRVKGALFWALEDGKGSKGHLFLPGETLQKEALRLLNNKIPVSALRLQAKEVADVLQDMILKGEVVAEKVPGLSYNMAVWWDGDLLRELLDKGKVSKYDWKNKRCDTIFTLEGCAFNNGTKSNPSLQGDLIGDWREEVLVRTDDNKSLRLYVTTIPTEYRFHTFLEDPVYRISIATQNVAYNQPTQPGFYIGPELKGTFRGYTFK